MRIDDSIERKTEQFEDGMTATASSGLMDEIVAGWDQLGSKGRNTESSRESGTRAQDSSAKSGRAASTFEAIDASPKTATDKSATIIRESKCETDSNGNLTGFATADGREFSLTYEHGDLKTVTMPGPEGQPIQYVHTGQVWKDDRGQEHHGGWLDSNDVVHAWHITAEATPAKDDFGREIVPTVWEGKITIDKRAGGKFEYFENGVVCTTQDDGGQRMLTTEYKGNIDKRIIDPNTHQYIELHHQDAGSHIEDIRRYDPDTALFKTKTEGYIVHTNAGHVETIEIQADGTWKATRGDHTEIYSKLETDSGDNLKLSGADGSTTIISAADCSSIKRDGKGHVIETISPDGVRTSFAYDIDGKVKGLEIRNETGKVVEQRSKDISVNDADGSYTVGLDHAKKLERKVDGSEELKDATGRHLDSNYEMVLKHLNGFHPPVNPEQMKQLRADLAEIDKSPPEQLKKVLNALDKIAYGDATATTKITSDQRIELVTSLAHQLAHPAAIKQGDKNSCPMASFEQRLARTHPEIYADMVAKLAIDGTYKATDGRIVKPQFDKDDDGQITGLYGKTDPTGHRSLASELFQNAAGDLAMADGAHYYSFKPGDTKVMAPVSSDTYERIRDKNNFWKKYDGLTQDEQVTMMNAVVGEGTYELSEPIESNEDLITAYDRNHGSPLTVFFAVNSPFAGMGDAIGGPANHAVDITYLAKTHNPSLVYYDNTAGGSDHSYPNGRGVPIDDFVAAMARKPGKHLRAITEHSRD